MSDSARLRRQTVRRCAVADDEAGDSDDHRSKNDAGSRDEIRQAQAVLSRLGYLNEELRRVGNPPGPPGDGSSPDTPSGPPAAP
jgi:hypothetical protein